MCNGCRLPTFTLRWELGRLNRIYSTVPTLSEVLADVAGRYHDPCLALQFGS